MICPVLSKNNAKTLRRSSSKRFLLTAVADFLTINLTRLHEGDGMNEQFSRSKILLGDKALNKLYACKVAVFGVGGVGGYCVEALARCGVGKLHLYDDDSISPSNLNRQIIALHSTLGMPKANAMVDRIKDINPDCDAAGIRMFYLPENSHLVDLSQYDYVIDCIDTITAKLDLIQRCTQLHVQIISAMGTGNKIDPTAIQVTDLSKTEGCPLARVMRRELRKRGITHLKVVYSTEPPMTPSEAIQQDAQAATETRPGSNARKNTPGSLPFVPAAAGLAMAYAVVTDLIK